MEFEYELRRDKRIKKLSLSVDASGNVVLRIPPSISQRRAMQFLSDKRNWIITSLESFRKKRETKIDISFSRQHYLDNKKTVKQRLAPRVAFWSSVMDISYESVSVKDQKTRWGSCSSKGNLNFNYRIGYLPRALGDYVIVHELAHRVHMNHGEDFWKLVERHVPDQKQRRRELKGYFFG